jgi:hypothetical protein
MAEQYEIRFNLMADANTTAALQGAGAQGFAGGSRADQDQIRQAQQVRSKTLMQLIGIQFTMAALLKNSQIFTGTIGAVFSLLGGFIDITLSPFMPLFGAALGYLAGKFPAYNNFIQGFIPRVFEIIRGIGSGIANVYSAVAQGFRPIMSLFDKDGISLDGRLRLSDIITGLGSAVLGAGIFNALRTGAKGIVSSTVGSLMQGTIGKLHRFLKGVTFISLFFSGLNIVGIFQESGLEAGIKALGDFVITTIFATLGAVIGGSLLGPLGALIFGALSGIGYQKLLSPALFGQSGGTRAAGSLFGGGGPSAPSRAADLVQAYDQTTNTVYPVSNTQSFIASSNQNIGDYNRSIRSHQSAG